MLAKAYGELGRNADAELTYRQLIILVTNNANFYNENAISLPIYPDLNKKKQEYIIQSIKKFFNKK